MPPAARILDPVMHPLPPVLTGGPTAVNVIIGFLPAWRGIGGAGAGPLKSAKLDSEINIKKAEAATKLATGTPAQGAAELNEKKVKFEEAAKMAAMIASAAATSDIHVCASFPPILPPHGPGVVTTPSKSVIIRGAPAARMGDEITEAIGPPNKIVMGCVTVLIGD
ncbi:MAG: PAAR domain-containing protein [Pyrinomonadaceae bacterium]